MRFRFIGVMLFVLSAASAEAGLKTRCEDLLFAASYRLIRTPEGQLNAIVSYLKKADHAGDVSGKHRLKSLIKNFPAPEQFAARLRRENKLHPLAPVTADGRYPIDPVFLAKHIGSLARWMPEDLPVFYEPLLHHKNFGKNTKANAYVTQHGPPLVVSQQLIYGKLGTRQRLTFIHEFVHLKLNTARRALRNRNWGILTVINDPELAEKYKPYLFPYHKQWCPEEMFTHLVTGLLTLDGLCDKNGVKDADALKVVRALSFYAGYKMLLQETLSSFPQEQFKALYRQMYPEGTVDILQGSKVAFTSYTPGDLESEFKSFSRHELYKDLLIENERIKILGTALEQFGELGSFDQNLKNIRENKLRIQNLCQAREDLWTALDNSSGVDLSFFRGSLD